LVVRRRRMRGIGGSTAKRGVARILGPGAGRVRACARNDALRRCLAAYRGCAGDRHGERGGRVRAIALTALWWWLVACAQAVAAPPAAPPQLPMPRQISVYDGLPSNRINALAEDRQGYLWIATRDGLARYDGVGYRVWRVGDGLNDNHVWTVFVDESDRVWVGTQNGGLAMLDAQRRGFVHFDRGTHAQIGSNDVWSVAQTPDGAIWFGTADGGLHRIDGDGTIRRFMPEAGNPRSLPSPAVTWLRVDRRGRLWVGTYQG